MTHVSTRPRRISVSEVLTRLGPPEPMIEAKVRDRIDEYARCFIAHSPLAMMATADAAGRTDCSPRGDYPGFVKVLDERTIALPDRPGNKIADSFRNLDENDGVGLCFLVPGVREVLRVNGSGYVTDEPDVLVRMRTEAKQPQFAIVVEVAETYFHCGRALIRSRLWDPASQALAEGMPSIGEVAAAQFGVDQDPALLEQFLESGYRELY
ncbi:MSMEG_1061 family FMN-dependent PPOX-type flavoprotein [Streptomyces diacarni]|uniref:Pyridoxamine 5'-phosphate oxidase family protein n=1 Tax=Streptomyces diacarni TaxID=2800381 RepID=A0A367EEN2_9ACTN|nr:MSMEG_1061 family FMN-dependent PPOX-type flavoprotein [Streptomyces diacarni]RCG15680.1 pyridoxamine 5'-phosphate oxidase family protein [Streptomyces diacarni]